MKNIYRHTETIFEKMTFVAISLLGNSITFIVAVCAVVFFLSNRKFYTQDIHVSVGDVILSVTFLSLFLIQKSSNHFSAALHLKLNELIASNASASNAIINIEEKTEHEITELSKEYAELSKEYAELAEEIKEETKEGETKKEETKEAIKETKETKESIKETIEAETEIPKANVKKEKKIIEV